MKKAILLLILGIFITQALFSQTKPDFLQIKNNPMVDIRRFGAIGNGIVDDRKSIQDAIDYAATIGGTVYVPALATGAWMIKSVNPTYTAASVGLVMPVRGNITGEYSRICAAVPMDALLVLNNYCSVSRVTLDGCDLSLTKHANWSIMMSPIVDYISRVHLDSIRCRYGIIGGLQLTTIVSSFDRVEAHNCGTYGFALGTATKIGTSTSLSNCYASNVTIGYALNKQIYCSMQACAADNCDLGIDIDAGSAISIIAQGCEWNKQHINIESSRGVLVSGLYQWPHNTDFSYDDYLVVASNSTNIVLERIHREANSTTSRGAVGSIRLTDSDVIVDNSIGTDISVVGSRIDRTAPPRAAIIPDIFVSATGSDINEGTIASPVRTITEAVNRLPKQLTASTTIRVMNDLAESFVVSNIEAEDGVTLSIISYPSGAKNKLGDMRVVANKFQANSLFISDLELNTLNIDGTSGALVSNVIASAGVVIKDSGVRLASVNVTGTPSVGFEISNGANVTANYLTASAINYGLWVKLGASVSIVDTATGSSLVGGVTNILASGGVLIP